MSRLELSRRAFVKDVGVLAASVMYDPHKMVERKLGETINTLDYFTGKNTTSGLTGTHGLYKLVNPQERAVVYTKWNPDSFELYKYDDKAIYLLRDNSGAPNPDYVMTNGIWMKRNMRVGETIEAYDNKVKFMQNGCVQKEFSHPYTVTLEKHIPNYEIPGSQLGPQDVVVLKYAYSNNSEYELFYYSKEWGWIQWQSFKDGNLKNQAIFNQESTTFIDPNLSSIVSCRADIYKASLHAVSG